MTHLLLFLSSGLFLGWSLGANHAANVFGPAVETGMVRFRTAAFIASLFVILGATISGAGAAHTLGSLGAVNALAGSFTVALSAALTVFWMTRWKLPVSTSEAILGAIIGWNFYAGFVTDTHTLSRILLTWVSCPILSALFSMVLYWGIRRILLRSNIHILHLDNITRAGMIIVGAFGAYSLGANNIANVMGVFVSSNPFRDITLFGNLSFTGVQQLFFLGGLAIAIGIYTYSERVIRTVGKDLLRLSPVAAFVVVLAHSLVLFIFASEGLERFLVQHGLPSIPLVPVSSSQAIIGAIVGIGLIKRGTNIRLRVLSNIAFGWVSTPVMAGILAFMMLFFVENVFKQPVYNAVNLRIDSEVVEELKTIGLYDEGLASLQRKEFENPEMMKRVLVKNTQLTSEQIAEVTDYCISGEYEVTTEGLASLRESTACTQVQLLAIERLLGKKYSHPWQMIRELEEQTPEWRLRDETVLNREWNRSLKNKRESVFQVFDQSYVKEP